MKDFNNLIHITTLCAILSWTFAACSAPDPLTLDSDGDRVPDQLDAFPLDPNEQRDSDGDGIGDVADAFPRDPSENRDTDLDGVGNNADADDDNDGIIDEDDPDPLDPANPNA